MSRPTAVQPAMKLLFTIAFAILLASAISSKATATTYTVCDTCAYTSIQTAIDSELGPGVTILVRAGEYEGGIEISDDKGGSSSSQAVLQAEEGVSIVCGKLYDDPDDWTQLGFWDTYWLDATIDLNTISGEHRLFVDPDDGLYTYRDTVFAHLAEGEFGYSEYNSRVYVNSGGTNPGNHGVTISTIENGIYVEKADYVTIDGFNVEYAIAEGIHVEGYSSDVCRGVVVENCTSAYNGRHGIRMNYGFESTLQNNTTHNNYDHGIYFHSGTYCLVADNVSYSNDNLMTGRGGRTGIRIGHEAFVDSDVARNTIERNVTYSNEDTGIEVKGAEYNLLRHNQSYINGDHGFDHLYDWGSRHMNEVSAHNDHDGFSFEENADSMSVYNSIIVDNGQNPDKEVRQRFIADTTNGNGTGINTYYGDHNVIHGSTGGNLKYIVVQRETFDFETTSIEAFEDTMWTDWSSLDGDPLLVDPENGDLRLGSVNSDGIDLADKSHSDWAETAKRFRSP